MNNIFQKPVAGIPASGKLPNKSFVFIYLFGNSQKLNKSFVFIYHFVLGKILPDTFFKTLFFLFKSEMEVNQVSRQYNNVNYIVSTYNGFEIIVRKTDNYFNASKLIKKINELEGTNKQLKNLLQNKTFKDLTREISVAGIQASDTQLDLPNDLSGTYMNKLLINYVCMWCSIRYLIQVNRIMDSINEQNTTDMNKRIKDLQDKNNELKTQIIQDIGDQRENSKYIFIDQIDDNTFKIVYDQKKKNKQHYKTFEVLASANIAKNSELKKYYIDKHRRTFNLSNLEQVIKIISANHSH